MEHLGKCVAEWRASLLDKGLKVNAGKLWLVAVVGRLLETLGGGLVVSVGKECTVFKKWIHKRGSGDLSQVADGFMCR